MGLEKGLLIAVGVAFVGFVSYKIIKKKNPKLLAKMKDSVAGVGKKTADVFNGAGKAFQQGYASA